jgi:hypothetical protein
MTEIVIGKGALGSEVLTALTHLKTGKIGEAIDCFAEDFRFKDHGIGLEFSEKKRLAKFFKKARTLYPDSSRQTEAIFVSGDHVIIRWALQVRLPEPLHPGHTRKVPDELEGVSIVRTDNGKITDWADYYNGVAARRKALTSYFTDWVKPRTQVHARKLRNTGNSEKTQ